MLCTCNMILKGVRFTIFAVEKEILSVAAILVYLYGTQIEIFSAPYFVTFGLSGSSVFPDNMSYKARFSGKTYYI